MSLRGLVLAALFIGVPILEIWLLLLVGRRIGLWPTLAFVVAVGVVGAALARAEGSRVLRDLSRARQEGRVPEEGLVGGLLVLNGGLLLVLPGLISDVVGVLLLFPPTRRIIGRLIRGWIERKIAAGSIQVIQFDDRGRGADGDDKDRDVIDVDVDEAKGDARDDDR